MPRTLGDSEWHGDTFKITKGQWLASKRTHVLANIVTWEKIVGLAALVGQPRRTLVTMVAIFNMQAKVSQLTTTILPY